jgi:hypothetical protein
MARRKRRKKIRIKPSKRGTFTAWCKRQGYGGVTSACIAAGKRSKSAAIRKKATFAGNARKWKKGGKRKKRSTSHNPGPIRQTMQQINSSLGELF